MLTEIHPADLARRVAGGADPEAEAALCAHFAGRIRAFGLRHLRDGAAADDLVQQALLTVLQKLREGAVRDAERIGAFVLGVCRMLVTDTRRTAARRADLLERFGAPWPVSPPPDAEPLALARLGDCLNALSERERTVLRLTFYAERDAGDIARELRVTPGNVRVIRHRSLERLRRCLEARGRAA